MPVSTGRRATCARVKWTRVDEFGLIDRFFRRENAGDGSVVVGIGDDGAVLGIPTGRQLVCVVDTLVTGVHFPVGTPPADIGWRALAVNLSDIAAMGAEPRWFTLALTLDAADEQWLDEFAGGLFDVADRCGAQLVGGDTTRGPMPVISIQLCGTTVPGRALLRTGANAGDGLFVTGTVGDAAAGLDAVLADDDAPQLVQRFRRPQPRLEAGRLLAGAASAAIDVSDGLLADLGRLCVASGVGAVVDVTSLPLSAALTGYCGADAALRYALTGGDDYELLFAYPAGSALPAGVDATRIGEIRAAPGVDLQGAEGLELSGRDGYRHFR